MATDTNPLTTDRLRLGHGMTEADRERVVQRLAKLGRRLAALSADGADMELRVKDRDTPAQVLTLEVHLAHLPPRVATSREQDLMAALAEVREDMIRQIGDQTSRRQAGGR